MKTHKLHLSRGKPLPKICHTNFNTTINSENSIRNLKKYSQVSEAVSSGFPSILNLFLEICFRN